MLRSIRTVQLVGFMLVVSSIVVFNTIWFSFSPVVEAGSIPVALSNTQSDCASRTTDGIYDDYHTIRQGDNFQWVYEAHGTDLLLTISFTCNHPGVTQPYLLAIYRTVWDCENVGSENVTTNGSAMVFNGKSGLTCTGQTVQDALIELLQPKYPERIYDLLRVDDFYVKAHVQPYSVSDNTRCVTENKSILPVFDDSNINYRLFRSGQPDRFVAIQTFDLAYRSGQPVGHTFYTQIFQPPAYIYSAYANNTMVHTLDNVTPLGSQTVYNKTLYLALSTSEIKVGHDGSGNFFCGYIIDLEIDPIEFIEWE